MNTHYKKTIMIIVFSFILIISIVFIFLIIKSTSKKPSILTPTPSPHAIPTTTKQIKKPTIKPIPTLTSYELKKLRVVNVNPSQNLKKILNPVTSIEFFFSEKVYLDGLYYEITPLTEVYIRLKPETNSIIISPKTIWKEGITIITILPQTISQAGNSLDKIFIYQLNTAFPKTAPPESPGL